MPIQSTLVLIKPDAMKRNLMGPVLTKLQESKLNLIAAKLTLTPLALAKAHYAQHEGKDFYPQLLEYITGKLHGNPPVAVLALVFQGDNAIQAIRTLAGNTNPEKAAGDTIRGMFGRITTAGLFENVIHASATPLEAEREIKLWFEPKEILNEIYKMKKDGAKLVWESIPTVAELG